MALPRMAPAAFLVMSGLLVLLSGGAVNAQVPGVESTRDAHLSAVDGQPVHPSAAAGAILVGLGAVALAAGVYLGVAHGLRRRRHARMSRALGPSAGKLRSRTARARWWEEK